MKNLIILLLTAFILSCATAPPPQILDDGFISSRPSFQVQFHKPIVKKSVEPQRYRQWDIKTYTFWFNNREGVVIEIAKHITTQSGGYYFLGPEAVLTNMGRIALDSVVLDGRQWIKFVDVTKNEFLVTGYFRYVDESYISVFRVCSSGAYAKEIEFIKSGTPVNYQQKKLLNEEFASTDQLFSIGKVAKAELEKEKPKVASISKDVSDARVSLRNKPTKISNEMKIKNMLVEHGFFEMSKNFFGAFDNDFVDNNDGTITDKATGLMWQKSGSLSSLDNRGAKKYIRQLNKDRFAGHSDWRMPTVEELASLIKKDRRNGVHIDPIFDSRQNRCWTVDSCEPNYRFQSGAWVVSFKHGEVRKAMWSESATISDRHDINDINYVKAVRSVLLLSQN